MEKVQQPEAFTRLIELRPSDSRLWGARAGNYVRLREWAKAGADYTKTLEFPLHPFSRAGVTLELAALHLLAGDEAQAWLGKAKAWLEEMNQSMDQNEFGFSTSNYQSDWLSAQVLLREAEMLLSGKKHL